MLIMTISPSTSAASTVGLRDRTAASLMLEVGSVLDTIGIAVAPVGRRQIYFRRAVLSSRIGVLAAYRDRRRSARPRIAVLLGCAADWYGSGQRRPRRRA